MTINKGFMTVIKEVLQANAEFARDFPYRGLSHHPRRKLAVVACMDTRLVVEEILGLKAGEAHILRNAGGIVTEDMLRSLIISHHLLGTQEILILNHTECGMMGFQDDELRRRLERATGTSAASPQAFHSFSDLEENVREQVRRVKEHPWMEKAVSVRGFVYEVGSGRVREVAG
jgi:carbonic anhydrase